MNATVAVIISSFLALFGTYLLGSLSGYMSEKSGVVNIAIEGNMCIGAFVFGSLLSAPGFTSALGAWSPFVALLIAGVVGMIYLTIFSVAAITFLSDQIIAATALNIIAPALAFLGMAAFFGGANYVTWSPQGMGWAGNVDTTTIIFLIIAVVITIATAIFMTYTKWGLRVKAAGENPYALETSNISVTRTRYYSLLYAGFLGGLAGAMAIYSYGRFSGSVFGMGFIALAILIFGQWRIWGLAIGSFVFAILSAFANNWLALNNNFPYEFINMIPFIMPIIILMIFKNSGSPKYSGRPYKKDMRE